MAFITVRKDVFLRRKNMFCDRLLLRVEKVGAFYAKLRSPIDVCIIARWIYLPSKKNFTVLFLQ